MSWQLSFPTHTHIQTHTKDPLLEHRSVNPRSTGIIFWTYQSGPGIGYLKTTLITNLVLILGPFFKTFIPAWSSYWVQDWIMREVLTWYWAWYRAYIYIYTHGITSGPYQGMYLCSKVSNASIHTILVGSMIPVTDLYTSLTLGLWSLNPRSPFTTRMLICCWREEVKHLVLTQNRSSYILIYQSIFTGAQ